MLNGRGIENKPICSYPLLEKVERNLNMEELKGKVAIITGGGRGIGESIVRQLASQGCCVVISDVDFESANKVANQIKQEGGEAAAVKADISDSKDVEQLIEKTLEIYGQIDILVNNAGITRDNLTMRMSEEEWDLVLRVNLKGAFLCTRQVIRPMMKQKKGKVINISSVVGVMGNAGQVNYASSKAGLIGLTKSVAKEVASRNIQVNAVAPGYIETEMTKNLPQEVKEGFLDSIPSKKPGSPEDVARTVAFLASSYSDYITGQVIHVDGGLLM
jgi:3-oxoacyl-[acyl-carrier protein] reductase